MNISDKIVNLLDYHFGKSMDGTSWFTFDNYEYQDVVYLIYSYLNDSIESANNLNFELSNTDFSFSMNLFSDFCKIIDDGYFTETSNYILGLFNEVKPIDDKNNLIEYVNSVERIKTILSKYVEYI